MQLMTGVARRSGVLGAIVVGMLAGGAWADDQRFIIDIGLTDAEHTRDDGFKRSVPTQINAAGFVIGSAERYAGGSEYLGNSAWLFSGTTTIRLGFTDAEHTSDLGYQHSDITRMNWAGQVIGFSSRFNGGELYIGASAWLYDGTTTVRLGLTGDN